MIKKNLLKIPIFLLFVLLVKSASGQQLHHQMLSSMGSTSALKSGMIVLQTVGQQSVTGNASVAKTSIQQGFQQSMVAKFFPIYGVNTFVTTVYPNPFSDVINIQFSQSIAGELSISLYNMFGVLISQHKKQDPPLSLSFNFEYLPSGSYIIHLTANNYAYSKTLIKQ
jgi:hypothetical protein